MHNICHLGLLSIVPVSPAPPLSDTTHPWAEGPSCVSVTPAPPADSSSLSPAFLLPQDTCTFCSLCRECCPSALHSPAGSFLSLLDSTGMSHLPHHMVIAILSKPPGYSPTPPGLSPATALPQSREFAFLTIACLPWLEQKLLGSRGLTDLVNCYFSPKQYLVPHWYTVSPCWKKKIIIKVVKQFLVAHNGMGKCSEHNVMFKKPKQCCIYNIATISFLSFLLVQNIPTIKCTILSIFNYTIPIVVDTSQYF